MNAALVFALLVTHFVSLLISDLSLYGVEHFVTAISLLTNRSTPLGPSLLRDESRSHTRLALNVYSYLQTVFSPDLRKRSSSLSARTLLRGLVLILWLAPFALFLVIYFSQIRKAKKLSSTHPIKLTIKSSNGDYRRRYYLYYFTESSPGRLHARRTTCGTTFAALDLSMRGFVKHTKRSIVQYYSESNGWMNVNVTGLLPKVPEPLPTEMQMGRQRLSPLVILDKTQRTDTCASHIESGPSLTSTARNEPTDRTKERYFQAQEPSTPPNELLSAQASSQSSESTTNKLSPGSPCYDLPLEVNGFKKTPPASPTKGPRKFFLRSSHITQLGLQPIRVLERKYTFSKFGTSDRPIWQTTETPGIGSSDSDSSPASPRLFVRHVSMPI